MQISYRKHKKKIFIIVKSSFPPSYLTSSHDDVILCNKRYVKINDSSVHQKDQHCYYHQHHYHCHFGASETLLLFLHSFPLHLLSEIRKWILLILSFYLKFSNKLVKAYKKVAFYVYLLFPPPPCFSTKSPPSLSRSLPTYQSHGNFEFGALRS